MKKRIFFVSILLIMSILFSGCNGFKRVEDKDNVGKGKLERPSSDRDKIIIPLTKLNTLDPLENNNFNYYNFSKLMYEGLFEFDKNLKVKPLLVDNYSIEDDGKKITLELKKDIYWHNGDKLTTEDIDFTIKTIKNLNKESIYKNSILSALGSFRYFNIKSFIKTNIIDENKIELYFDNIYSNNLEALTFPIVNKDSYSELEDEYTPIGTGPYKYKKYNTSNGVELIKNDRYWNGEVNIPRILGRIFQDEDLIVKAFEDGRTDFVNITGVDGEKYKKDSNTRILEYTSSEYEFLGYNFKNKILNGEKGEEIRKAIYYGINRQEIIGEVYLGHATQVDTPIHPDSYLTNGVTNIYGHNIEKAKDILKDSGFDSVDSDGILKDNLGRRLSFRLLTNSSNRHRMKAAEIIKENLKDIGIEILLEYPPVDIDSLDNEKIDEEWKILNKTIKDGKYDIALLGWELSLIQDLSFMFHSSFKYSGSNFIKYNDNIMDNLLEGAYINSQEDKKKAYEGIQNYIMEELPYGSLYFTNKSLLSRDNIKGPLEPTFFNLYRGLEKCMILE
ncbi:ABC transporter substrate-binding protein [Tissierella creatinophila]|uniref:Oligopeptide-binding protein AppA n=1 Tax=Tissierella creatinophila DSM 6911 TaxID=1123403 RepID=A0A1U7M7M4_TISCR|nr:ABC transporter substrate-binding protein [Tissierella creatinophila]OLS03312.1 oligopeptide-binding protein AppA precursor [Tissierella creatinophila DSM 6911]